MRHLYFLLFFTFFTSYTFSQSPGDIIITEIMINPTQVADAAGEWFEVYNTTTSAIDMNGWRIKDLGTNSHTINATLSVPAGGFAILARSGASTNGGAAADYIISNSFGVANSEDEIILELPDLTIIDQVNYDGGSTFPNPPTAGRSLSLDPAKFNSVDNDSGANWCASTTSFGSDFATPGANNDSCSTLSVLTFNSIQFNMYPNPTSTGFINIKTASNQVSNITIFNVLGKQVISQELLNNTINISNLSTGIYIVKLTQGEASTTKKLVIE